MENIHGGDWTGYKEEFGREALDFSANVSPLGMPEKVKQAAIRSLDLADRYPDPLCRKLRKALSVRFSVPEENILCGSGASDLIERLVRAVKPRRAMLTAPTFSEYAAALKRAECEILEYSLSEKNDFRLTAEILAKIHPGIDLMILCEPNNPTGITTDPALLRSVLLRCRKCGCLLAVDECFLDFLDEPEKHSLIDEISGGGLLILRAFTKFYGMAGLRLGYCFGDRELLLKMEEAGPYWSVSIPAQEAGIAALSEKDYAQRLRTMIASERVRLKSNLQELGFRVIPGEANYLLFQSQDTDLREKLIHKGIMVRSCGNYTGLDGHWFRIAVRTGAENKQLIQTLKDVI